MIDRYLVRYFLAVVDNGSFSGAARQANVSQPTLSVGIAKLESLIGAILFHRNNQRVRLTEAGARFLSHARRIESAFNDAQQAVSGIEAQQELRVGWLGSIASAQMAVILQRMKALDPGARVELVEGNEREMTAHIARGRVDIALALVGRGGERFLEEPLAEEGYALALPADHPLAGESSIPAEALGDNVMIVRRHCEALSETSRHFTERGVRPFFALRSTNDDRVLEMVGAGLGITVMPAGHRAPGVIRPAMTGFDLKRRIGLVYGPEAESFQIDPPAFVAAVRAILRA